MAGYDPNAAMQAAAALQYQYTGASGVVPPYLNQPNGCRALYLGNLAPQVNEELLVSIFSTMGPVASCKIIRDPSTMESQGYGFIEFFDPYTAQISFASFNGRTMYGYEIKVNWASAGLNKPEDNLPHFTIFVGDLSAEIDDALLYKAFSAFGSIADAKVQWDTVHNRSCGYGFVSFRTQEDAETALTQMHGEMLGSRVIRCNWARDRGKPPR